MANLGKRLINVLKSQGNKPLKEIVDHRAMHKSIDEKIAGLENSIKYEEEYLEKLRADCKLLKDLKQAATK